MVMLVIFFFVCRIKTEFSYISWTTHRKVIKESAIIIIWYAFQYSNEAVPFVSKLRKRNGGQKKMCYFGVVLVKFLYSTCLWYDSGECRKLLGLLHPTDSTTQPNLISRKVYDLVGLRPFTDHIVHTSADLPPRRATVLCRVYDLLGKLHSCWIYETFWYATKWFATVFAFQVVSLRICLCNNPI